MFDFKENLEKRAEQKEQYQNYVSSQKEEFDRIVEDFKTTYLDWYKKCEDLKVLNSVDCFLRDVGFEHLTTNSLSSYYSNDGDIKVELWLEDVAKSEKLPFKFGIVLISYKGNTTFLKLLGDKLEDTTDPMPF